MKNKQEIRARLTIYGHGEMSDKEFKFFKEWLTKVVPQTANNKRGELSEVFRQTLYKQDCDSVSYHVIPHTRGWAVRKTGSKRNSGYAETRRGAEKLANRLSKKCSAAIYIHDDDGKVIDFIKPV